MIASANADWTSSACSAAFDCRCAVKATTPGEGSRRVERRPGLEPARDEEPAVVEAVRDEEIGDPEQHGTRREEERAVERGQAQPDRVPRPGHAPMR
jgi:hypothetical protein